MTRKQKISDPRVKASAFPIYAFLLTFVGLAVMTTGQMLLLNNQFDISTLSAKYIIPVLIYWIFVAAAFTFFARWQFVKRYQDPMEKFAETMHKVAEGDFSVYVAPRHLPDKRDHLDVIMADFNTMVEALGSIETLKTDFFSNVSHEIKTPLATIQNYAQGLKRDNLTEVQRELYIDTIIESSDRLSNLISNILKLNKLEKQTLQPVCEPYDVCEQICECALRFETVWAEKNIEFEADIEERLMIEADQSLLELVWNNLISNAIKFTSPGGRVTLHQTSINNEIVVRVSDSGCGMDEETLKHIFDKFYQGDTSHSTEGNGLGLALVLRILQLIDGSITASSTLGEGSTFTVRLPIKPQQ